MAAPAARDTAAVAVSPRVTQKAHSASRVVNVPASGGATSSRRNAGSQAIAEREQHDERRPERDDRQREAEAGDLPDRAPRIEDGP